MLEAVPELLRAPGEDPLAAAEDVAELAAEFEIEHEAGNRGYCRALDRPAERLRELLVSHRFGRSGVDGAAHLLVVQRPKQDPDLVLEVDPGEVHLAAGERAADAEL